MKLLEDRILRDGRIYPGNILKVDSFLNHQIDVSLLNEAGREFYRLFDGTRITKLLTIEASGISVACIAAQYFNVPVLFAKKTHTKNIAGNVHTVSVESFTHGRTYDIYVSGEFLCADDSVLLIDDFLAKGNALMGLIRLVRSAGAEVAGAGIMIEKGFQGGGELVRAAGVRLESLAVIESMNEGRVQFKT